MKSVSCILLLVERGAGLHRGLSRALLLARHFGARLELLLCETQCPAAALSADSFAAERTRADYMAEGTRYLDALRQTIVSPEVEIGAEVLCTPSLAAGLAQKLRHLEAPWVVKAGRASAGLVGPLDWRLMEQCSAPLLLTAGRSWRATPRFAAALDLSKNADEPLSQRIIGVSEVLAQHCGAELDYLYAAREQGGPAAHAASEAHRRLHGLLPAGVPGVGRLQYCSGDPAGVLPRLIAGRDYDVLAVGVGAVPRGLAAGGGMVTAALLQAGGGDVLLVPRAMKIDKAVEGQPLIAMAAVRS